MQCSASFRIFSSTGSASTVTKRLGLEPTKIVERGQRPRPTAKSLSTRSAWRLSTEYSHHDLAGHVMQLLEQIEPVRETLLALVDDGYLMDWWCSVESLHTEPAIELAPGLLARLAALPAPLLIDAWTTFPDEQ